LDQSNQGNSSFKESGGAGNHATLLITWRSFTQQDITGWDDKYEKRKEKNKEQSFGFHYADSDTRFGVIIRRPAPASSHQPHSFPETMSIPKYEIMK